MPITPAQITWRGPSGHVVVLDEDFVSLRPGGALEESEINTLLAIIAEAKRCRDAGTAPVPTAPVVPF
jgi:hypothetical protein